MLENESVTHWVDQLPEGDRRVVQKLWERFFPRLVRLARTRLKNLPVMLADEEDVALSAFDSVIRAVEKRRFPKLEDRDDLWKILVVVADRKATNLLKHETREKRDQRITGALHPKQDSSTNGGEFRKLISGEPDPQFAATMAEECQRMLATLPNESLQSIALAKMEGFTNKEIADRNNCHETTIERKLSWIRDIWQDYSG